MNLLKRIFFQISYYRNPCWDTGITPPELVEFINSHSPGQALDLGCGTGTNVITLAKNGWRVKGIDYIGKAIRTAKKKAKQAGILADFQVGDVTRLDKLEGQYDLILDIGCLHSLSELGKQAYIDNLDRLLNQQGTYLMYGFISDDPGSGSGLSARDFDQLADRLILVERQDGTERGEKPSAWFRYQKRDL